MGSYLNKTDDLKTLRLGQRDQVLGVLSTLPTASTIRQAMPGVLRVATRRIRHGHADSVYVPPLFNFVASRTAEQVLAFDHDLQQVTGRVSKRARKESVSWLVARLYEDRRFSSKLFELSMRARALRAEAAGLVDGVNFDVLLPNGRDVDIQLLVGDRHLWLECTELTDSDDDRKANRLFNDRFRRIPTIRPEPRFGDPYFGTRRIYEKYYDKLAKDGNPEKTQTSDDEPNAFLISFGAFCGPLRSSSPSADWAFEDLFGPELRTLDPLIVSPRTLNCSLDWLLKEKYGSTAVTGLAAMRHRLGAVLSFDAAAFQGVELNPTAYASNAFTPSELNLLSAVFAEPMGWEISPGVAALNQALHSLCR